MATRPKAVIESRNGEKFSPITIAKNVLTDDGQNLHDILSDRKEDMMTPTIENSSSMFKVGQGDNVDYSSNVVNGAYESMVLKGKSMVNCIQEPSSQDVVLPYEFEDGQYVTINDTKESGALSVELKGQTLVNLYELTGTPYQYRSGSAPLRIMSQNLIQGKTYMIILNFSTVNADGKGVINFFPVSIFIDGTSRQESNFNVSSTGVVKIKYTPSKTVEDYALIIGGNNFEGYNPVVIIENAMIIEYVEGMENWDIPYFEGMTSCKMPILHTVGKNLFNINGSLINGTSTQHTINDNSLTVTGYWWVRQPLNLKPNTTYTVTYGSVDSANDFKKMAIYCNGTSKYIIDTKTNTMTFETPTTFDDISVIFYCGEGGGSNTATYTNIQIEEDSSATTYEPYKTSILSLPEEVVLRNIGSVKDTLNLNTGDYIQRIGEVVLDGSEDEKWTLHQISSYTTHTRFEFSLRSNNKPLGIVHTELKCDRFTWINGDVETEHIKIDGGNARSIFLYIQNSKLATQDVGGLRAWLSQNPTIIQYQLETPITTKVDVQGFPHAYKNGHIQLSSGSTEPSLTPTVTYKVPVSRVGQIASNTKSNLRQTIKLDQLEILAYQS